MRTRSRFVNFSTALCLIPPALDAAAAAWAALAFSRMDAKLFFFAGAPSAVLGGVGKLDAPIGLVGCFGCGLTVFGDGLEITAGRWLADGTAREAMGLAVS